MKSGKIITEDSEIKHILADSKTIAVLGLSPKPERDSHIVAKYLKEQGYKIIPVRPKQKEILGEKAYSSIEDIKEPVDIVNVFRNSSQILPHAHEAVRIKPKVFWMQLNIENYKAAELLTKAGINVVMNHCISVEHDKFSTKTKYREKRLRLKEKNCYCCTNKAPFFWRCRCGFAICQDCMHENFWGMSCNGITWECPDCGGQNNFGNQ